MSQEERDSIADLKRRLESRTAKVPPLRRSRLEALPHEEFADWSHLGAKSSSFSLGFLKKLLIVAAVFFLLMLGLAAVVFWRGGNMISPDNVQIEIRGPLTVRSGEQAELQLTVTNRNNSELQFVDLIVEYPPGTKSADNATERDLNRERIPVGDLSPGANHHRTIRAILFGEQDRELEFKVTVEYRLGASNPILAVFASHRTKVSFSPLVMNLSLPDEVKPNQEIKLEVELFSNAKVALNNLGLVISYPPGFAYQGANLVPARDSSVWEIKKLEPGARVRLTVTGVMLGQLDEQKSFRVAVGTLNSSGRELGVVYNSDSRLLTIRSAFVNLVSSINGLVSPDIVTSSRETLRGELSWTNMMSTALTDVELLVVFDGAALDPATVVPTGGFYRSSDRTIVWNSANQGGLSRIEPGQSGKVNYVFSSVSLLAGNNHQIRNPQIVMDIKLRGKTLGERGETELVEAEEKQVVQLNSVMQLAAKALYHDGTFTNTGPLPPRVGMATTYTIVWTLNNSSNDAGETVVTATVPPYIRWLENVRPSNEEVVFRPAAGGGGELIWNLGLVRAGTGYGTAPREISFQIELVPSLSQVGQTPVLLGQARFSGVDSYTKQILSGELRRPIETTLLADSEYRPGQDMVVE